MTTTTREINLGDYTAVSDEHGGWHIWDDDDRIFFAPPDIPEDALKEVLHIYLRGFEHGKRRGRSDLQWELKRLMGGVP